MNLLDQLEQSQVETWRAGLEQASDLQALETCRRELLEKAGHLGKVQSAIGGCPPEERKVVGARLGEVRKELTEAFEERKALLEAESREARYEDERRDLTELLGAPKVGHAHIISQTQEVLEDVFLGMGYVIAEGPELEDDWHNFEALNFPPGHPARSNWDTYHVDSGAEGSPLMRTHTSPVQIRTMEAFAPPIYAVMPGQTYRRETPDARHLAVFHQIEGLVIDRHITFADLAGCIDTFTKAYFGEGMESRLRPGCFPFTEPSAEFEVTCIFCSGDGCRTCSQTGWIELGGCGMVDPNVLEACHLDPEEWGGFAFGFGIERLAQLKYGFSDARVLLDNDLRFLQQA